MGKMSKLPDGYFHCAWCKGGVRYLADGSWPRECPHCGVHPHPSPVDETVGGKVDPAKAATSKRNRAGAARQRAFAAEPAGKPVLGVDPGAKYTGIVLRDGDWLGFSETYVRADGVDPCEWMHQCVAEIKVILAQYCPPETKVAVEGVSAPKGFKDGKRAPINPEYILMAGVVFGGVAATFNAHVVPPGGNGSQHITHYPPALVGRRPSDLPGCTNGAGTRDHEQSAWDVAGKAAHVVWATPVTDLRRLMEGHPLPSGASAATA